MRTFRSPFVLNTGGTIITEAWLESGTTQVPLQIKLDTPTAGKTSLVVDEKYVSCGGICCGGPMKLRLRNGCAAWSALVNVPGVSNAASGGDIFGNGVSGTGNGGLGNGTNNFGSGGSGGANSNGGTGTGPNTTPGGGSGSMGQTNGGSGSGTGIFDPTGHNGNFGVIPPIPSGCE